MVWLFLAPRSQIVLGGSVTVEDVAHIKYPEEAPNFVSPWGEPIVELRDES